MNFGSRNCTSERNYEQLRLRLLTILEKFYDKDRKHISRSFIGKYHIVLTVNDVRPVNSVPYQAWSKTTQHNATKMNQRVHE